MIHHIKRRIPDAEICGFTLNPEDTRKRHNIPTYPISSFSTNGYHISQEAGHNSFQPGESSATLQHFCVAMIKKIPFLYNFAKFIQHKAEDAGAILRLIIRECAHFSRSVRILKGFQLLIVSGGGQLDDFWGGPWGQPYALLKWALIARLTRTRFVFMSVGTSSLDFRLSRRFIKGALSLAYYRSFRDEVSKERLQNIAITHNDRVLPDLAYSLPLDAYRKKCNRPSKRPIVAVSPISYCDPRTWPRQDQELYDDYILRLANFVAWLLNSDYEILLFASTASDLSTIDDVRNVLASLHVRGEGCLQPGIPEITVRDLLTQLSGVDFVVASRLHGVILSHMLNLPVLALSHDPKVDIHMANNGQKDFCLNIEEFNADTISEAFARIVSSEEAIKGVLRDKTSMYTALLDEQYDLVFRHAAY
ncbi:hypothetical protein AOG2_14080 [Geobacter sp. AOG2]|nr:hypothetical protein AOG2_14080 [Geobacter sp. AOG2]